MVETDKFLVVVSILEGRNFPKRHGFQLLAEARFDGELLSSDLVPHVEHPEFTQELAWELNKKSLQQHRLQRSSIKVQVYAVNSQSTGKEAVGYIVLDLRSATTQQSSKWHMLLHGKYHKTKPEVRVGLYVDEDKGPAKDPVGFKAREAPPRTGKGSSSDTSELNLRVLKPLLNESEGLYQIGPKEKCSEHFVISVTVAFAMNLPQLIPTNVALPNSGFFFYYSLLGNDVTNECFSDLINPNFAAERASVRVRSSIDALRLFFSKQPGLQIHLCCGDQSLGSAEVPLQNLIKKGSTEIYMRPVTLEGAFPLASPNRLKSNLGVVPDDLRPTVGVSVAVRKEDVTQPLGTPRVGSNAPGTQVDEQTQTPRKKKPSPGHAVRQTPPEKLARPSTPATTDHTSPAATPPRSLTPSRNTSPHGGSYTDEFENSSKTEHNVPSIKRENNPKRVVIHDTPEEILEKMPASRVPADHLPPTLPPTAQPNQPATLTFAIERHPNVATAMPASGTVTHHYCCSIDMRSIRNTDIPHPSNVFLRYTYAFFGSVAPIFTHPPIELRKGTEAVLPQAFCAFDFATSHNQLLDTFSRVPLVIEVWNRDSQRSENTIVGICKICLSQVLQREGVRAVHSDATQQGWRQVWAETVPVVKTEGDQRRRVGELQLSVTLEDWGPLTLPRAAPSPGGPTTGSSSSSARPAAKQAPAPPPPSPRQAPEYKVALELEMWKAQQEAQFDDQLQAKEKQYMLALAEEWKRRNKEHEVVLQKKISAYTTMEEQLKTTLADLNKRDRQLSANEQEVMRLRTDLKREHERKMMELKEASRRHGEDCEHQVNLERNKIKDLEETIKKYKLQVSELETRYQALQREFTTFREQQNAKPEVRLQSEINLLTLEKVELERKLEALTKSKLHYKQQWGRALKELARLKQREQTAAKQDLRRQQQELEHMRLRYLAAEEKEVVNSDKQELEDIKRQIQQLKEAELVKTQPAPGSPPPTAPLTGGGPVGGDGDGDSEHVARLVEERDTLLNTGVYSIEDRIIAELDRQIREAISGAGRTDATTAVLSEYQTNHTGYRPKGMVIR